MAYIAVANQKGGVGKTSVTLGLAAAAARRDQRVLIIDLDPQANATTGVGLDPEEIGGTVNDLLTARRPGGLADVVVAAPWAGVDVVPSTLDLANRDLDGSHDLPFRLREAMEGAGLDKYDLVLFDCPPSVGRLLLAGLVAATHALLVTDASADGLRGIANVQDTVQLAARHMNPVLTVTGIVVNRRRRTGEQDFRETELREAFGSLVTRTVLPERASLPQQHGQGQPITTATDEGGRVLSMLFTDLLKELEERTK